MISFQLSNSHASDNSNTDTVQILEKKQLRVISCFDGKSIKPELIKAARYVSGTMRGNEKFYAVLRRIAACPNREETIQFSSYADLDSVRGILTNLRSLDVIEWFNKTGLNCTVKFTKDGAGFISKDCFRIAVAEYIRYKLSPDELYCKVIMNNTYNTDIFTVDCIYRVKGTVYYVLINTTPDLANDAKELRRIAVNINRLRSNVAVVVAPNVSVNAVKSALSKITEHKGEIKVTKVDTLNYII